MGNRNHSFPFAGDHHTLGPVNRGNRDFACVRGKHFLHARFRGQQRDHLPVLGQHPHQTPAGSDQLQPIGQAKDPRHTRRRHFPHTVPNQDLRLHPPALPQLRQRILEDKERRLGVGGIVNCDV